MNLKKIHFTFYRLQRSVAEDGPQDHAHSVLTVLGLHLLQLDGQQPLHHSQQGAHPQHHQLGDHHLRQGSQRLDIAFASCSIGERYTSSQLAELKCISAG